MKKINLYNKEHKEQYLESLPSDDLRRVERRFLNCMFEYESRLRKDISEFSLEEIVNAILGSHIVMTEEYKRCRSTITRYREYCGATPITMPSVTEIKQAYIDNGVFPYALSDKDLYETAINVVRQTEYQKRFLEMSIAYLLLMFYGVSEQQCLTIPKSFTDVFTLPNGKIITDSNIQDFFVDLAKSTGYSVRSNIKGETKSLKYMDSSYLLREAYYISSPPEDQHKDIDSDGLNIIRSKCSKLSRFTDKLLFSHVVLAGLLNDTFNQDLENRDFRTTIMTETEIKNGLKNGTIKHDLTLVQEERYQLFKAIRIKNSI